MLTVTFIRHGESTDNLKGIWAGWADAPLSNHGMNQARALGQSFSNTPLAAIFASPLKRAHTTAQALHDAQPDPKPPITLCPDFREQHFGVAEGKLWSTHREKGKTLEQMYAEGIFTVPETRSDKFPEGESRDDVATRAERGLQEWVMPFVWKAARSGTWGEHIAVVSHGLCISELVAALMRKNAESAPQREYVGLLNTAWTRVVITVKGANQGEALEFTDDSLPPLVIRVTHINQHEHIDKLVRQKGGIGSQAYDSKQKDIRAFFGGGGLSGDAIREPVEALESTKSNVHEEKVDES